MYKPLSSNLIIGPSTIDGLGLFSVETIPPQTNLGISHIKDDRFENGYIRTPLGGFVNHSEEPNCEIIKEKDFLKIKTIKNINAGQELTLCYSMYNLKK